MKKSLLKFLPLIAAVTIATSCSKDDVTNEPVTPGKERPTVPFTIKVSTGKSLSKIAYADNTDENNNPVLTPSFTKDDMDAKLQMVITDESNNELGSLDLIDKDGTFSGPLKIPEAGTELTATVSVGTASLPYKVDADEQTNLYTFMESCPHTYSGTFTYNQPTEGEVQQVELTDQNVYLAISTPMAKIDLNGKNYSLDESKQIFVAMSSADVDYITSLDLGLCIPIGDDDKGTVYRVTRHYLPKPFSVADGKQVYFSCGNLQATYNGTEWSWGFAPSQTSYIGEYAANTKINGNGTVSENGTVDLFGWVGKSSEWTGAAQYGISNSNTDNSDETYGNVADEPLKSDWGKVFGKDSPWRTLTGGNVFTPNSEWYYLFKSRTGADKKYGLGSIEVSEGETVHGLILLPDDWTYPPNLESSTSEAKFTSGTSDWSNSYTADDWAKMEANGAVFLPAAGFRNGAAVYDVGSVGFYWSSSAGGEYLAWTLDFCSDFVSPDVAGNRSDGQSVRLVRPL